MPLYLDPGVEIERLLISRATAGRGPYLHPHILDAIGGDSND